MTVTVSVTGSVTGSVTVSVMLMRTGVGVSVCYKTRRCVKCKMSDGTDTDAMPI